jgi:hypothetical protein
MNGEALAETALSDVDGERGRLVVAGYDVEELAGRHGFEDVCALLWDGELPDQPARTKLQRGSGRGAREGACAVAESRRCARGRGRDGRVARFGGPTCKPRIAWRLQRRSPSSRRPGRGDEPDGRR